MYCLIGPNGSGKSTIVRTVAGLLHPTGGTVKVCGIDAVENPVAAKSRIGYIPDEPAAWSGMTGEEFLHFVGALFGVSEVERTRRIPDLLDIFSLQGLEHKRFDQYSRGNRQKFSILAALIHDPKLLLIDEPIVGLDPTSARIAISRFRKFADDGGAVLLVTHTLSAAKELADTIGFLDHGVMKASGTLPDLRAQAQLSADSTFEDVYERLAA